MCAVFVVTLGQLMYGAQYSTADSNIFAIEKLPHMLYIANLITIGKCVQTVYTATPGWFSRQPVCS